jgi:hypothetical protein
MKSTDGNSEDTADKAFAELFELFSKPKKSPQKAYRTYQLTFENGEPIFTLSEADRILGRFLKRYLVRARKNDPTHAAACGCHEPRFSVKWPLQPHLRLRSNSVASRNHRRVAATSAVYRPCL